MRVTQRRSNVSERVARNSHVRAAVVTIPVLPAKASNRRCFFIRKDGYASQSHGGERLVTRTAIRRLKRLTKDRGQGDRPATPSYFTYLHRSYLLDFPHTHSTQERRTSS